MWVHDLHLDGLRLDAVHAIFDQSAEHVVAELARRVHAVRPEALVIAESGLNDPKVVRAAADGGWGCDAAWADDVHHAVRTLVTDEREGYYAEFGALGDLAHAFRDPHIHDGRWSAFRKRRFGAPAAGCPPERFVVFDQNHDQVGNRALGDRLPPSARPLAAFCTLLSPYTPLLFMGEEYGERAPFQFFTDHIDEEIAIATREGRRREFASFARFAGEEVPDPQDPATFERSKLTRRGDPALRELYVNLLRARRLLPRGSGRRRARRRGRVLAARPAWGVRVGDELRGGRAGRRGGRAACRARHARGGGVAGRRLRDAATAGRRARGDPAMSRECWPGEPFPLGAVWDGQGTNFSLFSENAERVELCLFDADGHEERVEIVDQTAHNWHCYLPGVGPGQRYGYRVHGRYAPAEGHRFNPNKLLIDPYAKAIDGTVDWDAANALPYTPPEDGATDDADFEFDDEDSAPAIPKCVVVDESFNWEDDRPPRRPWTETIIYETHVKGLTKQFPGLPPELQGTYAGLASDEMVGLPQGPGRHRGRAAARPSHRRRAVPARARADQLLGLLDGRLPRAALARTRPTTSRARTSRSSRGWSRPCIARAWRSSSTSSTTTPPRATTSGRCCRSRASTTPRTTG